MNRFMVIKMQKTSRANYGQWMSGEQKGYCFGFEVLVGKTSLAKHGLSMFKDEDGNLDHLHL